jgi:Asp-tRNA(Asn)/Glu-tRNA(Gln) amidotransferase A subunit family amidase
MARTVKDMTVLLDAIVGYDPDYPLTAYAVGHIPDSFTHFLDGNGLKAARLGILREPMGIDSKPESEDFKKVSEVFDNAVAELRAAGAEIVDPIIIPQLNELLAKRAVGPGEGEASFRIYFGRSGTRPFKSIADAVAAVAM